MAANARNEWDVIPAPSAATAAPECFMRLRRSIIAFLLFDWSPPTTIRCRLEASAVGSPFVSTLSSTENRQPTRVSWWKQQRISFFLVTFLRV
jgi:hypothetical protein